MKCSSPLYAVYNDLNTTLDNKKKLVFIKKDEYDTIKENKNIHKLELPCGHCIECRINKAQDWSTRAVLESRYYSDNWFITLTFEDSYMPYIKTISRKTGQPAVLGQLRYDYIQKFMKDIRKFYSYHYGLDNIRFLVSGEYGDNSERAHFHILLYNLPIDKRDLHVRKIQAGHIYYDSPFIAKFWPYGNNIVTDLNLCTSAYVARYVLKKFYGQYEDSYQEVCKYYGVEPLRAEFIQCSRRPGIAHKYFTDEFSYRDFLENKKILFNNGKLNPIPKYFNRIFKEKPEEISDYEDFSRFGIDSQDLIDAYNAQKLTKQLLAEAQTKKSISMSLEDYNAIKHDLLLNSFVKRDIV